MNVPSIHTCKVLLVASAACLLVAMGLLFWTRSEIRKADRTLADISRRIDVVSERAARLRAEAVTACDLEKSNQ
jgi:sulfite exporter TauE/SafE